MNEVIDRIKIDYLKKIKKSYSEFYDLCLEFKAYRDLDRPEKIE